MREANDPKIYMNSCVRNSTCTTREPSSSHAAASTFKVCARKQSLLTLRITCLDRSRCKVPWYNSRHTPISRKRGGKVRMKSGQFVVVHVRVQNQLSVAQAEQHKSLCTIILQRASVTLHTILLGVMGAPSKNNHELEPLKELGLIGCFRANKNLLPSFIYFLAIMLPNLLSIWTYAYMHTHPTRNFQ